MKNLMISPAEASDLIQRGIVAVIAGDEAVLRTLPKR